MKAIGERIKYFRIQVCKQTQEDFATTLVISRTGLSVIENHQHLPGCYFLHMLHTVHQVNLHLTGEGEVQTPDSPA